MSARHYGRPTTDAGEAVLHFWFEETKPYQWFRRDLAFDAHVASEFGALHKAAKQGRLNAWRAHSRYALSLIILLDQFSRNIYRDDPRAFAQDEQALDVAREAIRRRFDQRYGHKERAFFYMPFMHAERLDVQNECVGLFKAHMPGTMNMPFAIDHRDIVARYGRFPHRNKLFDRPSTPKEIAFLRAGGFNP